MKKVLSIAIATSLLACGKSNEAKPESTPTTTAAAAAPKIGCAFLHEAKVKAITGVAVTTHAHGNPQSCAMFQTPEGKDYLLVSTDSAGSYGTFLESNPPSMFPVRTPVPGVGTEALLLRGSSDPDSLRTLIVHNDSRTMVLTPQFRSPITDPQLIEIARAAAAAP